MSRREALLRLYRLALCPPEADRTDRVAAWMAERQAIVDTLGPSPPAPLERPVERALLALILHADRRTYDHLVRKRRELAVLMKRPRAYG